MGINFFSKTKKITKTFEYWSKYKLGQKITDKLLSKDWSGYRKTYSSLGFPSGVASSVVKEYTPNNHRSGVTNILYQLANNWILKYRIGNIRVRRTYSINKGRSLLSSSSLLHFQSLQGCSSSPVKKQYSRYKMIHIYISRLDKSHIRCRNINIYQTKIHETHMEEGFSLLSIMKKFRLQPNPWDKDSSAIKGFWVLLIWRLLKIYHNHNFSLQYWLINSLPKVSIYTLGNRAVSKVEEVETVEIVND